MGYTWKITLNSVDISDKVSRFSIHCSLDNFCREMTLDISDPDLYAELDFSQVSEAPEIEIFTKTGESWISQGEFFVERPALATSINAELMQGVWGRSLTALLAEPFAPKVTQAWETQTTFFSICEEMCDLAGFAWDETYSDVADFVIYPYTYEADGLYPINVISELAMLAGALVTTDRLGHLCIKEVDYSPAAADATITDADIAGITENPEWPTFGNRVRITPTGALASYSVELFIPDSCLHADGSSKTKMFAQVRDPDGEPVDGLVVAWEIDSAIAALNSATSNTQEILINNERQRATGFYSLDVDIPPSSIDGIWAYRDTARATDLAEGGYTLDGRTITLTDKLAFCDQSLVISYRANGIAINYLQAGATAEDVTVTADVAGQQETGLVYIGNPCECPPTIRLTASPTSLIINEAAKLLVYVEDSGPVTNGRMVFMAEVTAARRGDLPWTKARLGQVPVANEKTTARNEIAGVTQCDVSMFPASVSAVYLADEDGEPYGSNLYSSHDGKVIDLSSSVATGTDLVVNYTARGAALNLFTATALGTAKISAYILTTSEESVEASASIKINDKSEITDDYPSGWIKGDDDGDYGGVGGLADLPDIDYDTTPASALCRQSNGEMVQCGESERCCSNGVEVGCFPSGECVGGEFNPCVSDNVSDDPSDADLAARFSTGLSYDCSCAEMCNNELDIYGTTQDYDGASGRTLSDIVIEDYALEEGSPEYWEKLGELKAEAIYLCTNQCITCGGAEPMTWDTENNPETIVADSSEDIFILDGLGPFQWSVSGLGYTLDAEETTERQNGLTCAAGTCGVDYDAVATITVTDACGGDVTADIRNTAGGWVLNETVNSNPRRGVSPCGLGGTGSNSINLDVIVGDEKWNIRILDTFTQVCAACPYTASWVWDGGAHHPPCGSAYGCTVTYWVQFLVDAYCATNHELNTLRYRYYQWGCP